MLKFLYIKIILNLDRWLSLNPDLCLDTYHKQLNFKFDQNINKKIEQ